MSSATQSAAAPDTVLVVDFGAQYAQLIARRVREARVYSEIVPSTMPVQEMLARNPAAIILSGGPSSVYEAGAPTLDRALFEAGVPVFGMCYGFQLMAQTLGGTVDNTGSREYGRTDLHVSKTSSTLFEGTPDEQHVWMSHGDACSAAPEASPSPPPRTSCRSPRSRTTTSGSTASSTTPRSCTPRTASRCWSTSCTAVRASSPTGPPAT